MQNSFFSAHSFVAAKSSLFLYVHRWNPARHTDAKGRAINRGIQRHFQKADIDLKIFRFMNYLDTSRKTALIALSGLLRHQSPVRVMNIGNEQALGVVNRQ